MGGERVNWSKETGHEFSDAVAKFESNYEEGQENECWEWTGTYYGGHERTVDGLDWRVGRFLMQKDGKRFVWSAHRFMWAIHHGYPGDAEIRRACNNPKCVNINHLEAGTREDTIAATKRRGKTKAKNTYAKKHDHAAIVVDYHNGMTYKQLMQKYGITSKGTISHIIKKSVASGGVV